MQVVVITGLAQGMGREVALRLAASGDAVAGFDVDAEGVASLRAELEAKGARCLLRTLDVCDRAGILAFRDDVLRSFGRVDVVLSNVGIGFFGPFEEVDLEKASRCLEINVMGTAAILQAFLPGMRERRSGRLVAVSSLVGQIPFPFESIYSATKYAVRGASHALRMELEGERIGVTTVLPGTVATRLLETATSYDRTASSRIAELMLARGMKPSVVAERVVRAIRANEAEVTVGWDAHLAIGVHAIAPALFDRALAAGFRWRERRAR